MLTDGRYAIELENTGEVWDKITDFSLTEDYFTPADQWSVTVFSNDPKALRRKFLPLTPISLYVDDRRQLIGRIMSTDSDGTGALRISGLDYMGDLVSSGIDPSLRITGNMTLEKALLAGLKPHGITKIETTTSEVRSTKMGTSHLESRTSPVQPIELNRYRSDLAVDTQAILDSMPTEREYQVSVGDPVPEAKPNDGEGAYEWAARICARAGFVIQPGSSRDSIAVVRPNYSTAPVYHFARRLDGSGNIERGSARRDWSSFPTGVSFRSRVLDTGTKMSAKKRTIIPGTDDTIGFRDIDEVQRILAGANAETAMRKLQTAGDVSRYYVPAYYKDGESKSEKQLQNATRRFVADRLRETLSYSITVPGREFEGGAGYTIDTMAVVDDEIEDVSETLWVMSRTLSCGEHGEKTSLRMIRPQTYVL